MTTSIQLLLGESTGVVPEKPNELRILRLRYDLAMRYTDVSRAISHALRHEPWLYELELDDAGWVPVEDLLAALRAEKPAWAALNEGHLVQMMAQAEKQRYEMRDGRIRALYGHSTPQKLLREPAEPPAILFHGTAPKSVALIRKDGCGLWGGSTCTCRWIRRRRRRWAGARRRTR
jgi:RNA:NAD 2'-phosphotransferase (TPT1/KptA family)